MAKRKRPKKLKINKQTKSTIWPNNQPTFLQNPSFTFYKFQICITYKLKKKKKKKFTVYCPNCAACHGQLTTPPVFLLGVCNATPRRQHQYTSFSLATLSFVCSILLLYLVITAQHCCEAVRFDRLVNF